jgi:3-oxoacyl-[acyl-carrier-protein] synthase II
VERVVKGHRVAITGMGVVTPLGHDVSSFIDALIAGRSGIRTIRSFDPASLPTRIAGEAELPEEVPFGDRKIAFALAAAKSAMLDASRCGSTPGGTLAGDNAGVSLGVGLELFDMAALARLWRQRAPLPELLRERLAFLQTPADMSLHLISGRYGLTAPPIAHESACAAGTDAIGFAARAIARGQRRFMLAGGADSMINPLGVAGFCALQATSTRNEEPERASRPFDRRRDGFVMGEGAGVLVLERWEDARERGATIHAEILGYGTALDAYKISDPHPEGRGAFMAMSRALEDASLPPDAVDAVNAHGTATPKNDPAETLALKRLLGERAKGVPISATKSMIGHLISAAGAVEAVAAVGCMQRGIAHPTINLEEADPACDLDYVPGIARKHPQRVVISSSYGFGGHNAALVFGAVEA